MRRRHMNHSNRNLIRNMILVYAEFWNGWVVVRSNLFIFIAYIFIRIILHASQMQLEINACYFVLKSVLDFSSNLFCINCSNCSGSILQLLRHMIFFFVLKMNIFPPFQILVGRRDPVNKAPSYNKKEGKKNIFFLPRFLRVLDNCKVMPCQRSWNGH